MIEDLMLAGGFEIPAAAAAALPMVVSPLTMKVVLMALVILVLLAIGDTVAPKKGPRR
ncbi:hypothetical protein GCM10007886_01460 [Methylobacterium gregans]|nr:hypothetical protein [Methylobacterium gregans]MDQ0521972.1 hypothetical protein [Methylobacterium gregans]GLS51964.1 hypothetical protein GCM10007886_01460 [Methylobacterium gregans]